jgi:hypothetical protein
MNAEWFLGTQSEATTNNLTADDIAQWYDVYMEGMEKIEKDLMEIILLKASLLP